MKQKHTSCEGCRYNGESCSRTIEKGSREDNCLKCWRAMPTKFEKIFSKAAIIFLWVISPVVYYGIYLMLRGL